MTALDAVREFLSQPGAQIGRLLDGGESAPYVFRGCMAKEVPVEYARHLDSLCDERTGISVYWTGKRSEPARPALKLVRDGQEEA